MKKILVIGSTNLDFVIQLDALPVPGETLLCKSFAQIPGGKGANQAYACGRLGGAPRFLSAVGTDKFGGGIIEGLKRVGVDCSSVLFSEEKNTGMAMICVDASGSNLIIVIPGANELYTKAYIQSLESLLEEADIVLAQLEIPLDGVYYIMKRAYERGKITILNPAPAPEAIPEDVYPCLHYITPNETELQKLTGHPISTVEDASVAAKLLLEKGVANVIVTLGEKGALLRNREVETLYAAPEVPVVDTTAAGDIIDDFGMERGTEYGLEQIYNVIDSRYRSKKPLIVTTNIPLHDLQHPQDTATPASMTACWKCAPPFDSLVRTSARPRRRISWHG